MKRVLTVVAVVLLALATVGAGRYAIYRVRAASYDSPGLFELARVHPEFGPGIPSELQGARLVNGLLQVVATTGACSAITGVSVRETGQQVRVAVDYASLPGDCTMQAIAVFVNVRLRSPLGNRLLVDGTNGRTVRVSDCSGPPVPRAGLCAPGRYGT